ncbi:MAG: hypothetical protein H8D67_30890 [Deltaproteobacteria bacterium]|nr:hypothetical protein [Deltaproteobacteria bacterium]
MGTRKNKNVPSYEKNTFDLRKKIVQELDNFYIESLGEIFYDAPPQRVFAKSLGLSRSALQWHLKWLKKHGIIEGRYPKVKSLPEWNRRLREIIKGND